LEAEIPVDLIALDVEEDALESELDEKSRELLAPLLSKGKKQGYLAASDVMRIIPDDRDKLALLDDLLDYLFAQGVEIMYDIPVKEKENADNNAATPAVDLSGLADDDAVGMYLREMGRVPLLTAEEEVFYAQQMERARAAAARLADGDLSQEDRDRLAEQVRIGEAARDRIIRANTRLVISIVVDSAGDHQGRR